MNQAQKLPILFLVTSCFLFVSCSNIAEKKVTNEVWVDLFNGVNFDGWEVIGGQASYDIVDGAIVGTSVANTPNTFLATKKYYQDFVLEFEFFVDEKLNSGVQFRSLSLPKYKKGAPHGYQFEMDPSERAWTAGIYDEKRRGWLYTGDYNPKAKKQFRAGQWNKARIECKANHVRTFLNGTQVAYLIDDPSYVRAGFIGLQVHSIYRDEQIGKKVKWRNLRISENLKDFRNEGSATFIRNLKPNHLSVAEQKKGWDLLFNGEKMQGNIRTKEKYAAFELQLEVKLSKTTNSGIKYFVDNIESDGKALAALEYRLVDNATYPDAKGQNSNRRLAALYDLLPPAEKVHKRKVKALEGKWNYIRIIARRDGIVEHWLNGYKVLEYKRGSEDFRKRVANSKFNKIVGFGEAEEGYILIQDNAEQVSYRSIKIKRLTN